jgi:hypothetical protein
MKAMYISISRLERSVNQSPPKSHPGPTPIRQRRQGRGCFLGSTFTPRLPRSRHVQDIKSRRLPRPPCITSITSSPSHPPLRTAGSGHNPIPYGATTIPTEPDACLGTGCRSRFTISRSRLHILPDHHDVPGDRSAGSIVPAESGAESRAVNAAGVCAAVDASCGCLPRHLSAD